MASHPRSRRDDVIALQVGSYTLVQDRLGEEIARLDGLEAGVWEAADGAASAQEIALRLGRPVGEIWAALDRLTDAGLMAERASPPGSTPDVSRRRLLTGVGLGAAAAAVALPAAAAAISSEAETKAGLHAHEVRHKRGAAEQVAGRTQEQHRKRGVEEQPQLAGRTQEQHRKRGVEEQPELAGRTQEQHRKRGVEEQPQLAGRTQEQHRKKADTFDLAGRSPEQNRKRG